MPDFRFDFHSEVISFKRRNPLVIPPHSLPSILPLLWCRGLKLVIESILLSSFELLIKFSLFIIFDDCLISLDRKCWSFFSLFEASQVVGEQAFSLLILLVLLVFQHSLFSVSVPVFGRLLLVSRLFLFIVNQEVVVDPCERLVALKHEEHSFSDLGVDLLAISTLANWLVLVQRIFNVDKLSIWNVLDIDPLELD